MSLRQNNIFFTPVPLRALIGVSLLYAALPSATGLRFRGHVNGSDNVCVYLDSIMTITVSARKGDEVFTREFTDRDIVGFTHQCEHEPFANIAYVKFDFPNFHQLNGSAGRFRFMYTALETNDVVLDRSAVIRPGALFTGLLNPDPLVIFKDSKTLVMGSRNNSYVCKRPKTLVFQPGETKDGYTYSLKMEWSFFQTQAFDIRDNKLGPSVRCESHSKSYDKAMIISCVAGGALVVSLVAAIVVLNRRQSSYNRIL